MCGIATRNGIHFIGIGYCRTATAWPLTSATQIDTRETDVPGLQGTPIVFCDTETTGVNVFYDDIWEIAAIRRDENGDTEHHLFVEHDHKKLDGLPERYRADHDQRFDPSLARTAEQVAAWAERVFAGTAVLFGANAAFDAYLLERLIRSTGRAETPFHYRPLDIEAFSAGRETAIRNIQIPWRSDDLAEQSGLQMRNDTGGPRYHRHTALDDARWVRDWYDHLTG